MTTAIFLLKTRMAQIELEGYPDIGRDSGDFGENSPYRWRSEVHDVVSDEFDEGLRAVNVTVTWARAGEGGIKINDDIFRQSTDAATAKWQVDIIKVEDEWAEWGNLPHESRLTFHKRAD